MLQTRLIQNIFIVLLLLVVGGVVFWGWSNGSKAAKSKTVVNNVNSIVQGFGYFHDDQNRYPTTGEFDDQNLMRTYITNYPPQSFVSKTCAETYDYFSADPESYELRFCLSKAVEGYNKGWNVVKK